MEIQGTPIAKTMLNKNTVEQLALHSFKTYCHAAVLKTE